MLACTEMITMCLQSAKQKHLQAQQQQQTLHGPRQGLNIFHDIFRRADKNDDGKLSFDEFNAYFADGILTTEELQELFLSIDNRQNNNLDTDKLSDYFSQHLGEYLNVLSALESLNIAILKAMDKTKQRFKGVSMEDGENWCSQINRLQDLLDKLECQSPKLEPLKEDTLAGTYKSNILLVQRQMFVIDDSLDNFRKVLKSYIDATSADSDNLHVSVQKLPGKSCYIIYEFWQDRISWMSYLQTNSSKDFQRCVIDMLEDAEVVSTMLLPASWWIMTNN
ncbi:N-terminal EF-hand calcium-binding protein 1 [Nematolebias whitei]|uniref:N-terminal EF-hand calcium-binding protein 1 n=1 Tax=Nematolebias whitei TaxID=451745 RepID=UPI00189802B0|nr:N-terminal EF-hand calcium-binding protein 1 [Nematolebias whitei]